MKFFKLFMIAALVATTVSCNSDDDSTPDTSASIVATWIGTGIDYTTTSSTTAAGQTVSTDGVGTATNIDYMITFNENPNTIDATGSYDIELTITAPGVPAQTTTVPNLMPISGGTWELNGTTLTVTDNGEMSDATIDILTETNLQLSVSETQEITQNGVTITNTTSAVMTFTKQ